MFTTMPKSYEADQQNKRDIDIAVSKSGIPIVRNHLKNGVDAEEEDVDGKTPLNYGAANKHSEIVKTQLENSGEVAGVTAHGYARLHSGSCRGRWKTIDEMLQHIDRDKVHELLSAKSYYSGNTALHLAAKCGSMQVVKSLLRHGAPFDSRNIKGVAPVGLTKDPRISTLLQIIEISFESAKNGNVEAIGKLRSIARDNVLLLLNCRDKQGHSLLQCAIANGHKDIADLLLKMVKDPGTHKRHIDRLKKLIRSTRGFLSFSSIHLDILRSMVESGNSDKNAWPWKTLKEGSYYLENVYRLIESYKISVPDPMCNNNIRLVNDTLMSLEFDPEHISSGYTNEAYGEKTSCFISKGRGTRYYNLLHSELKKDVKIFIELVEKNITKPLMDLVVTTKNHHSELHQLRTLKNAAEFHLESSSHYLPMLGNLKPPLQCMKNTSPCKTLQEGSNYLENVNILVKSYQECVPGPIENPYIKLVNNTLVALEFDPDHTSTGSTDDACNGTVESFDSKDEGAKNF